MSESLIYIGLALACSSGLITNFRLYELDRYLKESEKDLWAKFGFGNERANYLTKLYRLSTLAKEYTSDEPALERRLRVFGLLHSLSLVGIGMLLFGITWEIFGLL